MRVPEAIALVEAIMDGRVHRDYVTVGGQQCERRQMARPGSHTFIHVAL